MRTVWGVVVGCFVKLTACQKGLSTFYECRLHLHWAIMLINCFGNGQSWKSYFNICQFENLPVWRHWRHCDVGKVAQGAFACNRSTAAVYSTICTVSVAYKAAEAAMTRSENQHVQLKNWSNLASLAALYATETALMVLYTAIVLFVHAKALCATFPTS